jgi:excisionase family DNA binding protein
MSLKSQNQLTDLVAYSGAFVTVRQLAEYWDVSRKHVLKLIDTGDLESIRLGPKTYRVRVQAAVEFEQRNRSRGLFVAEPARESDEPRQSRHGT